MCVFKSLTFTHKHTKDGSEESEVEVDYPRPLTKGKDRNGGTIIQGDVDIEIIFDMLLREVKDQKHFKRQLEQELADAVDCRAKSIHVSHSEFSFCISNSS